MLTIQTWPYCDSGSGCGLWRQGGPTSVVYNACVGSASDRQVVERSALYCGTLETPSGMTKAFLSTAFLLHEMYRSTPQRFYKMKNRVTPSVRQADRQIVGKRVDAGRIIGMVKVFTISQHRQMIETRPTTQITSICSFLCNITKAIISRCPQSLCDWEHTSQIFYSGACVF